VNHVVLLEVNVDVRVGVRGLEILQHYNFTVGAQFFAAAKVLLRQSIRWGMPESANPKARGQHCGARGVQIGVIVSAVDRPERVDHRFQRCIAEPIYIFFQLRPNRQKKRLQPTSAFRMRIRLSGLSKMTPSFLQKQITRRGITRNRSRKAHLTFFCPYSMERRYVRSLPPSLEAEAYICLYTYMLF